MTVLVTGGAGFIGTNFIISWLAKSDEAIVNIDKLTYAGSRAALLRIGEHSRHYFFQVDIENSSAIANLLARFKPRAIVHFAAESHVDRSIAGPEAFVSTNIVGTFKLLECARQYYEGLDPELASGFRFLHVSTDEVFGQLSPHDLPATELSAYAPNSPYSASKAASDHLVRAYGHTYGLPVLTTHCSNNYGPLQYPEKLIPVVIAKALTGQPIPVYGNGSNIRDWLHVEDHCAALRLILEGGRVGETYNIGSNTELANIDLVRRVCVILDELVPDSKWPNRQSLISFVTDRPGHDWRYSLDASKLRSQLGWKPTYQFDDGLRLTIDWYVQHRDWLYKDVPGSGES